MNYELKEMKDVEVLHVTPSRILARGNRYGRNWLLRGLPPEKRNDTDFIRQLREEFDGRFDCLEPDLPITVCMEEIEGLGPCIVEEWREDTQDDISQAKENEGKETKSSLRRIWIPTIVFILLAGLSGGALYIRHLKGSYENAKSALESLQLANRQGEQRILTLADSLDKAFRNAEIPEEFARSTEIVPLDKEERITGALFQTKMEEFERELARYDRNVIPQVTDDLPVFYDSICALYRRMLEMGNVVDPGGYCPQLPEDDRIRLTNQLYMRYILNTSEYMKVWLPRARAAYKKSKIESEDGKENR